MIKAIIFDLDGTLFDSEPLWRKAEIKVFGDRGLKLTDDDCRSTVGMQQLEVVKLWASRNPALKWDVKEVNTALEAEVKRLFHVEGNAMPGVVETIQMFQAKGLPMAVASASYPELIRLAVEKIGVLPFMHSLHSTSEGSYSKPHPEVFLRSAENMGVHPKNCLVFEDSLPGLIAGKAAGMHVVAIPDEKNRNNPKFALADQILEGMYAFDFAQWIN